MVLLPVSEKRPRFVATVPLAARLTCSLTRQTDIGFGTWPIRELTVFGTLTARPRKRMVSSQTATLISVTRLMAGSVDSLVRAGDTNVACFPSRRLTQRRKHVITAVIE